MTQLDKLQSLLHQTSPTPNADAKAETLRLAAENFARLQESDAHARPISDTAHKRPIWKGITTMFNRQNLRPALYATSCLIVAGAVFTSYQSVRHDLPTLTESIATTSAPLSQDSAAAPQETVQSLAAQPDSAVAQMESRVHKPTAKRQLPSAAALGGVVAQHSMADIVAPAPQSNTDQFTNAPENPVQITSQTPVSTFSIDVDTASYSYVRSTLLHGGHLRPGAIRVEEMVNYFTYDYAAPTDPNTPFSTQIQVTPTPWNPDTKLVQIGIQGKKPTIEDRPPLNLVFLIDTSGSMQDPDKLGLLKQSFRLLLAELRPSDEVAIVTYAGSAGTALEPTKAANAAAILNALDGLNAGGSTAGQAGLRQAYQLAEQMKQDGDISRVLLATDGDFNVGINDPDQMKSFIEKNRDSGTYLSVLGFGRGNYRDDMMQTLAQNGNGTAAYIDTLAEAQKTLVDQLSGALFPIANDVKIQVEFNPSEIAEYRLIGYETRALNREDFNNDKVDAGEIGAGHQVTALYEITPVGSPAILNDPLRYAAATPKSGSGELGYLKLRYKSPGAAQSQLIQTPITTTSERAAQPGFATAIAGFAQLLKGSNYTQDWTLQDAITLATTTKGPDPYGYRAEAIRLMKLANISK